MVVTANGAGVTYGLEVERGGKRSDHSCDGRGSRDDIRPGGGEWGARGQITVVTVEGAGTTTYSLEMEGRARGQITVVTAEGAGMTYRLEVERQGKRSDHSCDHKGAAVTYFLEVERAGKRSDHSCDCRGSRDNIQSGGGEGGSGQLMVVTAKRPRMTYLLEVEQGGHEVRSQL